MWGTDFDIGLFGLPKRYTRLGVQRENLKLTIFPQNHCLHVHVRVIPLYVREHVRKFVNVFIGA